MNGRNSPLDAISPAIEHVKRVLFRPFDIGKWFVLGGLSFLQALGGGGSNLGFQGMQGHEGSGEELKRAAQWITEHLTFVAVLGFCIVLVALIIAVAFLWLSARGTFC